VFGIVKLIKEDVNMARAKKSRSSKLQNEPDDASPEAPDSRESENEVDDESNEASDQEDQNEQESESDEESEMEDEEDVTAIFKGVNATGEEGSDESGDDSSDERDEPEREHADAAQPKNIKSSEQCAFDLRNMIAVNSHQIKASSLYSSKKKSDAERNITIPLDCDHGLDLDENFLLDRASTSCTQLVQALWQLPTERSDAGPLVSLPGYDEIKIPRALVSIRSFDMSTFYLFLPLIGSHHPFRVLIAATAPETRNEMGKICKAERNPAQ
jgi:hypothetical protein